MTVSYVYGQPNRVSDASTDKVLDAAHRLGYPGPHPGARALRRGRAGSLGVVLGEHLTYAFDDPQAARFLAGVAEICAQEGVGLTLVPVTGRRDDTDRVARAVVDGFVVWTTADDDPILDAVVQTKLPCAVHGGPDRGDVPVVAVDDQAAARAIGRLIFAGANRPAVLCFPLHRRRESGTKNGPDPSSATFPVTRHRLQGFRQAWEQTGGSWQQVRVAICSVNSARQGADAATRLFDASEPPDALAAMSDELALGALDAARDAGLSVPDDVAISGWDDTAGAATAELTTVRQDLRDQGERCARIALGLPLTSEPPNWHTVHRASTRPPPE